MTDIQKLDKFREYREGEFVKHWEKRTRKIYDTTNTAPDVIPLAFEILLHKITDAIHNRSGFCLDNVREREMLLNAITLPNPQRCQCGNCDREGNFYECAGCGRTVPYCFGADDSYVDFCDDCAVLLTALDAPEPPPDPPSPVDLPPMPSPAIVNRIGEIVNRDKLNAISAIAEAVKEGFRVANDTGTPGETDAEVNRDIHTYADLTDSIGSSIADAIQEVFPALRRDEFMKWFRDW